MEQNLLYIADGSIDIKWHNHFGKEWQFLAVSNKIKHKSTLQTRDFITRYITKRNECICSEKSCTQMFILALFTITPNWKSGYQTVIYPYKEILHRKWINK